MNKRRVLKIVLIILASVFGAMIAGSYPAYLLARRAFNGYFEKWGEKLVNLEKRGLLSKEYGAGWQDVLTDRAMEDFAHRVTDEDSGQSLSTAVRVVDGISLSDYPSLSIIEHLREVREYSNTISITDRLDRPLASIRTDHRRARIDEFPGTLVTALLAAEDKNFKANGLGFEFDSFVRAAVRSVLRSVFSFHKSSPRGTSTITQQVAKLFISRLDESGRRQVSRTVDRKVRELRLAVALRKMYRPDDILEVYMNHCVTSDHGMIGYKDIARGLFGRELHELSEAQCIYLARMVKWGRNIRGKILTQCRIDMARMGEALGWDAEKQRTILAEIDTLTFARPRRFQGGYGSLVDLANEFWMLTLRRNGTPDDQLAQMDLIDPNSLIRKKGDLKIRLSIDLPLQQQLEKLVNARGYGPDTTIMSEIRIGSAGETVRSTTAPRDTVRQLAVLKEPVDFHEPNSAFITSLNPGDSVLVNIRYKKLAKNEYRRSSFYYVKQPKVVDGQYFAYAIMDSRTGKLLAYYSKDRIGSKLACLLRNRTPNGSSTAKPIMNALNFDLGIFPPYARWSDTVAVSRDVAWGREIDYQKGRRVGVSFHKSAVRGRGYPVHNHDNVFEGCQYIFDLLATSNNILGVETVYRIDRALFGHGGEILPEAFPLVQLLYRIGAFTRIRDELGLKSVTGVRVYKELARIVGVDPDSVMAYGRKMAVSDSMYSVALGTLEMTLYEQMHIFNVLYNNDIIERPADHPSLVIESIVLNGDTVGLNDTIRRYHPFLDMNNIRPTLLGMHKRLVSNRADGLAGYDVPYTPDLSNPVYTDAQYHADAFSIEQPLSNIAKSGTTDDVIRPFNADPASKAKTNFGIWNAVIRVDLARFAGSGEPGERDITVACVGECNRAYTGERDGKTLHKFLTAGLLKAGGSQSPQGYFAQYEQYLRRVTPASENCGAGSPLDTSGQAPLIQQVTVPIPPRDNAWLDSLGD